MAADEKGDPRGQPVGGEQTVDPSENVKALSEAANRRQDDLRDAHVDLFNCRIDCLKEVVQLRAEHQKYVDEIRAENAEKLRDAEAKRIDAIRAVDVNAVSVASQRAADQATALATSVAASAEVLRNLVASTATTTSARIAAVEQTQYSSAGRGAGMNASWAIFITIAGLVVGALTVFGVTHISPTPTVPQVVYVPQPGSPAIKP